MIVEAFPKLQLLEKASLDLLEKSALKTIFTELVSKLTKFWKKLSCHFICVIPIVIAHNVLCT